MRKLEDHHGRSSHRTRAPGRLLPLVRAGDLGKKTREKGGVMEQVTGAKIPTQKETEAIAQEIRNGELIISLRIQDGKIVYQEVTKKQGLKIA